jgi:hypothetical protein
MPLPWELVPKAVWHVFEIEARAIYIYRTLLFNNQFLTIGLIF